MRIAPLVFSLSAALTAGSAYAASPVPAGEQFPLPGYWEMTTSVASIIHDNKTERRCYGPSDVVKLVQPCNHHYTCTYSTQDARNGHLTLKGDWVAKKGGQVVHVSGQGTYTPESLHAIADMHTTLFGLPLSGTGEITAHRLGAECPPDAKH